MSASKKWLVVLLSLAVIVTAVVLVFSAVVSGEDAVFYGESDTPLSISNIFADNITSDGAIVNLTLTSVRIDSFSVEWGHSPEELEMSDTISVNGKRNKLSYHIDGLDPYSKCYYRFLITSGNEITVTDVWSFFTSDEMHSGAAGGSLEGMTYGIDVSFWNEESDFEELKKQGIDFVIIRCGSSYGKDRMFEYNYENAKAAGLKVGAYFYTYAMSVEESRQDADKCLSYICGKTFDLPVYMDIEESEQERTFSKRLCTEIVLSFCELIDKGGYIAGVYANRSWLRSTMNEDTIRAVYEVWLAAWTTDKLPSEDHSDKYGVWQYTDSGKIPGIVSSFVDRDVCYKDYSLLTDTFVYYPHYFLDWDGSVLHTYNMRAGYKIYPPSVNPSRECDDDYEYSFLSWEGLDENTLSSESGGSFTALYSAEEHSYGEWVKVGNFKMERECEKCGHVQVEYLEDVFLGDSAVWDLNDGVVQITGTGEMKDGTSSDDFGWKSYAPEILSVEIEDGITGIGNYEFSDLPVLESISLPMTLLSIGDYAFSGSSLTEIRIPASVEYISPVAFENCELTIICFEGSYAQEYAVTHNVPYTLVSPSRIKSGSVSGVTWFFYDNGELIVAGKGSAEVISSKISSLKNTITGITFGELISSVGKSQFSGLPLLRSVVFLGDTPRTVGDYAFKDCPKLGSVSLPAGSDVPLNAFTGTLVFD